MQGDAESRGRSEPEARVVLGVTEHDGECLTAAGRLGEERLDDGGAGGGALMLGPHRTGREADSGRLSDEAPGEHCVGDGLTIEDADERQALDSVAGCVDGIDVTGCLSADGELRCERIRHLFTITIGGAASPTPHT